MSKPKEVKGTVITGGGLQSIYRQAVKRVIDVNWNLSANKIGEELGITGIGHWIGGRRNFGMDKIIRICTYLSIPVTTTVNGSTFILKDGEVREGWT